MIKAMRRSLIALSTAMILAVALVLQALLHSALAGWIAFTAVFVLAIGRLVCSLRGGERG